MGEKGFKKKKKKKLAKRMKELFKLVWIHSSPPVALAQLHAESRLSDNHLFCECLKDWLFLPF